MSRDDERSLLHLGSGGKSWTVRPKLQFDGTIVTGTLEPLPDAGGHPGLVAHEVQTHFSQPNEFFLLELSGGRWVWLRILRMGVADPLRGDPILFELAAGAHMVDPPEWAKRGSV